MPEVQRAGHVLWLAPGQPGPVPAGEDREELEAVAGAPDREGIVSLHWLWELDIKIKWVTVIIHIARGYS